MIRYRLAKLLLLGITALVAELTALSTLSLGGARLELLFLLAAFAALFAHPPRQAIWACWLLGLLKDLGGTGPLGLNALLFLLMSLVILRLRTVLYHTHPLTQAGIAFGGCLVIVLVDALATSLSAGSIEGRILLTRTLLAALLAGAAAPVLFFLITRPKWLLE